MERKSRARTAWDYLGRIQRRGIEPNFWTSLDYFTFSRTQVWESSHWMWPEVDEMSLLPPLPMVPKDFPFELDIWTDFYHEGPLVELPLPSGYGKHLLDWEYIYDPHQFQFEEMGPKLKTFRKNVRKFPARWAGLGIRYFRIEFTFIDDCLDLLGKWAVEAEGIQDLNTIVQYIYQSPNKYGLWLGNQLVGFNIWDCNWKYINYRYSFYNPEIDFLSEYLRYRFFTDPRILGSGKMVNDGGTLDNPGLEFFKDRLQPIRKRQVHSWRNENENKD